MSEGTWKGSGVDSYTATKSVECNNEECEDYGNEHEADVHVDDWGNYSYECPTCGNDRDYEDDEDEDDDPDRLHDSLNEDW